MAYLDGAVLGTTPTLLARVAAGNHTLRSRNPDIKITPRSFRFRGNTRIVQCDLEKIPDEGTLIVDSAPSGAALFLNGTYKTVTPVTFEHIPSGNYSLEFRKLNYTGQNISFSLTGGETREMLHYSGTGRRALSVRLSGVIPRKLAQTAATPG